MMDAGFTYGAELELSDWPRDQPLAVGQAIDTRDVTMVNSDGVAVDPRGELYHLGGEIQTRPTRLPDGQAEQLELIMREWPETTVNYRSNLHVHVRIPHLRDSLEGQVRLQRYAHRWLPEVLPIIEPIPEPLRREFVGGCSTEIYAGARARWRRRKVSHQSLLKPERLQWQLEADTVKEFREREVRDQKTGGLHWAIHPRLCFNLRQLWETDTIEFRHFPGTTEPEQLRCAVAWCREFLLHAFDGTDPTNMSTQFAMGLPRFKPYDHWLEQGYKLTSRKYHDAETVKRNIEMWLQATETGANAL